MAGRSISIPFSGARLREQRERAGFDQRLFATALAAAGHVVGRPTVASWETGRSKPRPASLSAVVGVLADALGVAPEVVLDRLLDQVTESEQVA